MPKAHASKPISEKVRSQRSDKSIPRISSDLPVVSAVCSRPPDLLARSFRIRRDSVAKEFSQRFSMLMRLTTVVTVVAGDHDSKNQESTSGDFNAPHCSCSYSYSYSYSYSTRSSIAIRPIGPQLPANLFDQRSLSPQFKQPSSSNGL